MTPDGKVPIVRDTVANELAFLEDKLRFSAQGQPRSDDKRGTKGLKIVCTNRIALPVDRRSEISIHTYLGHVFDDA